LRGVIYEQPFVKSGKVASKLRNEIFGFLFDFFEELSKFGNLHLLIFSEFVIISLSGVCSGGGVWTPPSKKGNHGYAPVLYHNIHSIQSAMFKSFT